MLTVRCCDTYVAQGHTRRHTHVHTTDQGQSNRGTCMLIVRWLHVYSIMAYAYTYICNKSNLSDRNNYVLIAVYVRGACQGDHKYHRNIFAD
jgi:hypothetical protein